MTSQFRAFNRRSPADADPVFTQMAGVRANLMALASSLVSGGCLPGWSYTNSVTRSESSGGTAAEPARMYFSYGTGNTTVWVKVALTYSSGYPATMTFSWSSDNEASYDNLDDQEGNNVLTITYDASHNITQMAWSS